MGGYSDEAPVSLKSATVVAKHLNQDKYVPYPVRIDRDKWVYVDAQNNEHPIDKNDFSVTVNGRKITFDAVFNAIHGTPGEDGYLQAYFKLIGLPLTGCSMYASALTFNKRDMLSVLKPFGILSAPSYYLNKGEDYNTADIGSFPQRLPVISRRPQLTTLSDAISYNDIFKEINKLNLAIYTPSDFILPSRLGKYQTLMMMEVLAGSV